ncbi:class I SAM-dependent methyltransferase [Neorhizobium galegae]|uniref:class I SAM-dependent methyltransferase n=1 Tax=Neorhizobium galegae TaxID=399 RepID=UPI0020351BA6|nr:class I SAM-dependent methyltransferase [Neorhizobium galegae]MCM2500582.1 class I SAM-dependent methyltransferase [Neorhizobium galegae]MCQ1769948.1 class I SAM-dependent methyltransferase [Neorhizobium galegae]MCQ1800114.1 class I SAM-dependent methyltransferase [Neorhizobium galegae]
MAGASRHDAWQAGDSYKIYMGRLSRQIAPRFLEWLEPDDNLDWLQIDCGTGALSACILSDIHPKSLIAVDPSEGFLEKARSSVADPRVEFQIGKGEALSIPSAPGTWSSQVWH